MTSRGSRGVVAVLVVVMLAPVALAGPVDGWTWAGWWADAWAQVVRLVAGSETEPEPAEEPVPEDEATTDCATCGGTGDVRGTLDPNG